MFRLSISNVSKHYGTTLLFRDVCLELRPGDVVAVTGWNGSGKSTLVRIIAGLARPSAGRVDMFRQDEPIPKESQRRFIGMVAPALSLYDELTALENMAFFSRVRGIAFDRAHAMEIMDRVGLGPHADKLCGHFSSGMKQRLKLVQALLHKPPLLLLDEPGCNLDSKGMAIVEDMIERQRKSGMTIIASNEKREVDYADRILNLSE